ncbi:MAG TPA: SPFH domain-containing protein [Hyphomonadaceae bacterium]|jgi:regulator of protease activity HflC (stomatin/prohibitin superfamily)|nr:SPFH domain-containing protein [Hyphomonadaceae bacterium]
MSDTGRHEHSPSPEAQQGPPPPEATGAFLQSVVIGFRAVYIAIGVMAAVWLFSNFSQVAPGSQAVVMRFGQIDRTQDAGLVLALPRPLEDIRILPGPARQLSQPVKALPPTSGITVFSDDPSGSELANAESFVTGDGNIVLLNATLLYRISDPRAYVLSEKHAQAALDRLFRSVAVHVTAGRNLNDFLVVRTTNDGGSATALRTAVLDQLVTEMNARLQALSTQGAGLGVEIQRIDMTALLPPDAKAAFDAVLTASQAADQEIAAARTEAEQKRQQADRERETLVSAAQAKAIEMVSDANVDTAAILALAKEATPSTRNAVAWRAYRDRVARLMTKVGAVTLVDPADNTRLVLPGRQ